MQTELIAILTKHKGFVNLYFDKLNTDLVNDICYKEILADLLSNAKDNNFGYYNLLTKYGDSLPTTNKSMKECEPLIEMIINNLIKAQQNSTVSRLCNDFTKEYICGNNPNIDNLIDGINNASVLNDDFAVHDCNGLIDYLEHIKDNQEPTIDTMFGNFKLGSVVYLGGRPGMWKTTAAVNMLVQSAKKYKSVFYNMEMSVKQLYGWIGKIVTNQTQESMEHGINYDGMENIYDFMAQVKKNMYLIDHTNMSVSSIERSINRLTMRYGKIDVVYIDNLTLIARQSNNEYEALTKITRELKILAKKLNIVIVCIAQLNRDLSNRGNKKPLLRDLRGSGSIEQDADYVVFLHREAYYIKEKGKNPVGEISKVLEWHQAKNRFEEPQNGYMEINLQIGKVIGTLSVRDLALYNNAVKKLSGEKSNTDF